jgi:hypothetical protein
MLCRCGQGCPCRRCHFCSSGSLVMNLYHFETTLSGICSCARKHNCWHTCLLPHPWRRPLPINLLRAQHMAPNYCHHTGLMDPYLHLHPIRVAQALLLVQPMLPYRPHGRCTFFRHRASTAGAGTYYSHPTDIENRGRGRERLRPHAILFAHIWHPVKAYRLSDSSPQRQPWRLLQAR